jgi:hypothetical protein
VLRENPFTLTELRCLYADSCNDAAWYPDRYAQPPLILPATVSESQRIYYFEPQDHNRSVLGNARSRR